MRPIDALMDTIGHAVLFHGSRARREPGAIVSRMSPEHREALQGLTSADMRHLRMDLFWDERFERQQEASKKLMAIDRTFRLR